MTDSDDRFFSALYVKMKDNQKVHHNLWPRMCCECVCLTLELLMIGRRISVQLKLL